MFNPTDCLCMVVTEQHTILGETAQATSGTKLCTSGVVMRGGITGKSCRKEQLQSCTGFLNRKDMKGLGLEQCCFRPTGTLDLESSLFLFDFIPSCSVLPTVLR